MLDWIEVVSFHWLVRRKRGSYSNNAVAIVIRVDLAGQRVVSVDQQVISADISDLIFAGQQRRATRAPFITLPENPSGNPSLSAWRGSSG